jgi:predicted enzyme related to lactoylglutathione lyase
LRVLGIVYAGTQTAAFSEMVSFAREVLGMGIEGPNAIARGPVRFRCENGDVFAVLSASAPTGQQGHELGEGRAIGFLVPDAERARAELAAAGANLVGPLFESETMRWAHFRAPDGKMYEVVEKRKESSAASPASLANGE